MREFDIAIIGAGITGAAIARQLCKSALRLALIDAGEDIAMGASRANSAIVHAGYDCAPGSNMARLNVRGNELYTCWCEELQVPLSRCGSLVIAFTPEEEAAIRELYERGLAAHVPQMALIDGDRAREIEPTLSMDVTMALWAGTGGITCPYQMTIACAENARSNGCAWILNAKVTRIERRGEWLHIRAGAEDIRARYVVNAAGLFADQIAAMVDDTSFTIHPRKGEYLLLDRAATKVKTVVFQTPSALGKGILVSPTVDGNCFAGPTAHDQQDREDNEVTQQGIDELVSMARRSVPELDFRQVITAFAGLRAQPSGGDFIIGPSEREPRLIHAAGICSPGLTSAPAIAEEIEAILSELGLDTGARSDYDPVRPAIPEFRHMDEGQRRCALEENPLFGRVICRCEVVTEAQIVEAIRRGARSVDAVKRRTRAGMGRCQGGFCGPRVMEILARELGTTLDKVTKSGGESWLVRPMEVDSDA